MKQFRYVINGEGQGWMNCEDVSIEQLNNIAIRMNRWYGNNWNIEYRQE